MTPFLLLIIVSLLVTGVILYNRLVRDRNLVLTAWSDIDVQLKRRYDLFPKLVTAEVEAVVGNLKKPVHYLSIIY